MVPGQRVYTQPRVRGYENKDIYLKLRHRGTHVNDNVLWFGLPCLTYCKYAQATETRPSTDWPGVPYLSRERVLHLEKQKENF